MTRRRILIVAALGWAVVGAVVALLSFDAVNEDARFIVGCATVGGPLAATAAAWALGQRSVRLAGGLLLVSVLTPTYFAFVLNVPALVIGAMLLIAPKPLLRSEMTATTAP